MNRRNRKMTDFILRYEKSPVFSRLVSRYEAKICGDNIVSRIWRYLKVMFWVRRESDDVGPETSFLIRVHMREDNVPGFLGALVEMQRMGESREGGIIEISCDGDSFRPRFEIFSDVDHNDAIVQEGAEGEKIRVFIP